MTEILISEVLGFMQEIIDKEKARCGEANAFTCWYQLKDKLEEINEIL